MSCWEDGEEPSLTAPPREGHLEVKLAHVGSGSGSVLALISN